MTKLISLPRYLVKLYTLKTEIDRLLILSTAFSTLLLATRIAHTGSLKFVSLEWNLFLAFIPYYISHAVYRKPPINRWFFAGVFTTWLLFIPNSFYIITDLFHLLENKDVPLWLDLLLILSFAWNGLLMGILSVRQMEKVAGNLFGSRHELLFLYPVMWLNAFGVYIGRYLRYNSWDIITNPFRLLIDIFDILTHPLMYRNAWAMILCFSVFMTLIYLTIKKISRIIW